MAEKNAKSSLIRMELGTREFFEVLVTNLNLRFENKNKNGGTNKSHT